MGRRDASAWALRRWSAGLAGRTGKARAMLMLALASWDHRAEGKRAFADCWRGARFGESARGIGPTWAAEERVWADFGSLG